MILPTKTTAPFFIVGVHRSGTTLLRYLLSSHSRLYIPPESDFIPYFFGRDPHEQLAEERIAKIIDIIFTRYRFKDDWQGPRPEVRNLLGNLHHSTPAGFLNALYGAYARQNGAERWGDKTPIYASYIDVLYAIFPDAKFIHIIRDPFDAAISLLDKYEQDEMHIDIYFAARNWVRRIQAVRASQRKLPPSNYYELRYENLVQHTEQETRRVCEFLGEAYEPGMIQQHRLAQQEIPPDSHFFANVREPVFTSSIGRGRRNLSTPDQRVIRQIAGPLSKELGYPLPDLGEMKTSEKLRMSILAGKYEVLQGGRKLMTQLGLMPPI